MARSFCDVLEVERIEWLLRYWRLACCWLPSSS
jgi:hypothetical protein